MPPLTLPSRGFREQPVASTVTRQISYPEGRSWIMQVMAQASAEMQAFGSARIDNILNLWLKEHRLQEVRNADPESEHDLRDLLARQGVGVRPYKRPRPPKAKRS